MYAVVFPGVVTTDYSDNEIAESIHPQWFLDGAESIHAQCSLDGNNSVIDYCNDDGAVKLRTHSCFIIDDNIRGRQQRVSSYVSYGKDMSISWE